MCLSGTRQSDPIFFSRLSATVGKRKDWFINYVGVAAISRLDSRINKMDEYKYPSYQFRFLVLKFVSIFDSSDFDVTRNYELIY